MTFSTLNSFRRLRKMSEKRKAQQPARARCVRAVMARDKWTCRAQLDGCTKEADHVHELLPRGRGGDPTDPAGCIATCASCHRRLHDQPALAHELGLTISRKLEAQR